MRPDGGARVPFGRGMEPSAFDEPWQAELHALTVALHDTGLFDWDEWSAALGHAMAGGRTDGSDAWERWSEALVTLLERKGIATAEAVGQMADRWKRAAGATPHGAPITLRNDPAR